MARVHPDALITAMSALEDLEREANQAGDGDSAVAAGRALAILIDLECDLEDALPEEDDDDGSR